MPSLLRSNALGKCVQNTFSWNSVMYFKPYEIIVSRGPGTVRHLLVEDDHPVHSDYLKNECPVPT